MAFTHGPARMGGTHTVSAIRRYLRRRHNVEWLALDDDDEGWGHADINRLICTDPEQGISNPETPWRLQMALAKFA